MGTQSVDSVWETGPQQSPQLWLSFHVSLPDIPVDPSLVSYQSRGRRHIIQASRAVFKSCLSSNLTTLDFLFTILGKRLWAQTWVSFFIWLLLSPSLDSPYFHDFLSEIPVFFPCSTLSSLCQLRAVLVPSLFHLLSCFSKLLFSPFLPELPINLPRQYLWPIHSHFETEPKV